jgi:serine/threonine protein kinase
VHSQQQKLISQERIGRYEVLRKIATGGMAELFLAKHVGLDGFEKVVAIKRILSHLAFDEEFINMFRDEARIVAKLSHPNIVQIYDLGKSNDTYFIAMEYIPGRNFSSVAKKCKALNQTIPPIYLARCIAQICEGLHYAHTRQDMDGRQLGIVHRDVSPQNIIVSFSGTVKLVDFGIAKATTKLANTRAGVLKGKYAYMSPEQIRGEEIDARSDLFAVGIVLFELLCGRRPFEKDNSIQTLKAIVQERHPNPTELNSEIPDSLVLVIDKALAKRREDRYQTAQELQLALEDVVASSGQRCNSVNISEWMHGLFADEIQKGKGSTVVLKGVGEVILPDSVAERSEPEPSDPEAKASAELASGIDVSFSSAAGNASLEPVSAGDSAQLVNEQVLLLRGRGGGSVQLPERDGKSASHEPTEPAAKGRAPVGPRPGSARSAPSKVSRGGGSTSNGRAALIEEGVIQRDDEAAPVDEVGFDEGATLAMTAIPARRAEAGADQAATRPVPADARWPEPPDAQTNEARANSLPRGSEPPDDLGDFDSKTEFNVPSSSSRDNTNRQASPDAETIDPESGRAVAAIAEKLRAEEPEEGLDDELMLISEDRHLETTKETNPRSRAESDPWGDKTSADADDLAPGFNSPVLVGGEETLGMTAEEIAAKLVELRSGTEQGVLDPASEELPETRALPRQTIEDAKRKAQRTAPPSWPPKDNADLAGDWAPDGERTVAGVMKEEGFDLRLPTSGNAGVGFDADSRTIAGSMHDFEESGLEIPLGGTYDVDAEPATLAPKPRADLSKLGAIKLAKAPAAPRGGIKESRVSGENGPDHTETKKSESRPQAVRTATSTEQPGASKRDAKASTSESDSLISAAFRNLDEDNIPTGESAPGRQELPLPDKRDATRGAKRAGSARSVRDETLDDPVLAPGQIASEPIVKGPRSSGVSQNSLAGIGSARVPPPHVSLSEMLLDQSATAGKPIPNRPQSMNPGASAPLAKSRSAPIPAPKGPVTRMIKETMRGPGAHPEAPQPPPQLRMPDPGLEGRAVSLPQGIGTPLQMMDGGAYGLPNQMPRKARLSWVHMTLLSLCLVALIAVGVILVHELRAPRLRITTVPPGAHVSIDDRLQSGETPLTVAHDIVPGREYKLKIERDGYKPITRLVKIPSGKRSAKVNFPLESDATPTATPAAPSAVPAPGVASPQP